MRSSSVDVSLDDTSHRDTAVLPIINGHGPVRKPSVTSTRLNDPDTTPKDASAGTGRRRPSLAIQTITPVLIREDTTSTISTAAQKPRFDPMRAFRNSFLGKPDGLSNGIWKGKEKANTEKSDIGDDAKESRVAAKAREIREWMKGKSGSDMHRSVAATKTRQTVGGVRNLFKGRMKSAVTAPNSPDEHGPIAGQLYEIIERRIVESSSERTVEISTWREQPPPEKDALKSDGQEEDKISIYYISADEYPQEGEHANSAMSKVEWRADASDVPPINTDYSQTESVSRARLGSVAQKSHISGTSTPRKGINGRETHISGSLTPRKANGTRDSGKANNRRHHHHSHSNAATPNPASNRVSPSLSHHPESGASIGGNEKDTLTVPPKMNGSKFVENITAGSPTPPPKSPRRGHHRRGQHVDSSPTEKDLSPTHQPYVRTPPVSLPPSPRTLAPFSAKNDSGSTISSINPEATTPFEGILKSCEPSLMHIAPILRTLGIRRIEHLRAIGKLTAATRDREVRDIALKSGLTVMEWAILLDKILTL